MELLTYMLPEGIELTLRQPVIVTPSLVIILCQGFCDIREILLSAFAVAFKHAGYATLTFDYPGFGDSEGERGRLVPAMQISDILSVIAWANSIRRWTRTELAYGARRLVVAAHYSVNPPEQGGRCLMPLLQRTNSSLWQKTPAITISTAVSILNRLRASRRNGLLTTSILTGSINR